MGIILIFVSFESREDAEKVANYVIDNKLAACVSILPVSSFYIWKEKKVLNQEYEAIIKTKKENFQKIENAIKKLLPYEIPQIIAIKAERVNNAYFNWAKKQTD